MSDALARTEPVLTEPFVGKGITIALAPPMARFSLRARQARALETVLGIKLPKRIGETEGGAACLGPDEWLMRAPAGTMLPMGAALPVSITEVSERSVCLVVEGARAAEVLAAGCPLDLDRFSVGRATRTVFETVEIVLLHTADERFEIEVWRSFSPWLRTALETAARQLR
jgi:sarcosine oxidase, subunit gamma